MKCKQALERISAPDGDDLLGSRHGRPLAAHLAACPACAATAAELRRLRGGIADLHARAEPDPVFAARVLERLRREQLASASLGWAALRLLPAAGLLAAVALALASVASAPDGAEVLLTARVPDEVLADFVLAGVEGAP